MDRMVVAWWIVAFLRSEFWLINNTLNIVIKYESQFPLKQNICRHPVPVITKLSLILRLNCLMKLLRSNETNDDTYYFTTGKS